MATSLKRKAVQSTGLASHNRKLCKVCNHPKLAEIEKLYRQFVPPGVIANSVNLEESGTTLSSRNITHHCKALGLDFSRVKNRDDMVNYLISQGINKVKDARFVDIVRLIELQTRRHGELKDRLEIDDLRQKNTDELQRMAEEIVSQVEDSSAP